MSATGILRADNVIFYHPLDSDFKEHTTGDTWGGTAASVPGKVGQAESAVTTNSIAFGATNTLAVGGTNSRNCPVRQAALSDTKVVVVWCSNLGSGGDGKNYGAVGTVSGSSVTFGAAAEWLSGQTGTFADKGFDVAALDSSRVVVCYRKTVVTDGGFMKVGTVSGTDLTWGAEQQFETRRMDGEIKCVALDSAHVVVAYREGSATGNGMAKAGHVSGSTVSFGTTATWNTLNSHSQVGCITMAALTSTQFVLVHSNGKSSRVGTVNGVDLTFGSAVAIPIPTPSSEWYVSVTALSSTKVVLAHGIGNASAQAAVGTVSGADVTWGAASAFHSPGYTDGVCVAALGPATFVVSYRDQTGVKGKARIGTVSGTGIAWDTVSVFSNEITLSPFVSRLTATTFLHAWQQYGGADLGAAKAVVGSLDASAGLSGTGPYPSAIGATRVVAAMWAKKLTGGASTVKAERSYSVTMTATSVSLGGTTATWSGPGIASLMSDMNDDGYGHNVSHLLVLDFEHAGSGNWTLRTSIDGEPFVTQGTQTSGTQAVTTVNTAPSVSITSGVGDAQWLDELVMWAGDKSSFAPFKTEELANLHDLADTFGDPMDQYEENYGAPLCWQATARMPDGSAWRDSGSGPCPPVVRVPSGASDVVVTDDGTAASPRIVEG